MRIISALGVLAALSSASTTGCHPCESGGIARMTLRDGKIGGQTFSSLGSQTHDFGTLENPANELERCTSFGELQVYGPLKGPLSVFDHVVGIGAIELRWLEIEDFDAFPALESLGLLTFHTLDSSADPDRGPDDYIPLDAVDLRIGQISGFGALEELGTVRRFGGTVGDFTGFDSLQRIDDFDLSSGWSGTTLSGLRNVESVGDFRLGAGRTESFADLASLRRVEGDFQLSSMPRLRNLGFPALEGVGGEVLLENLGLSSWNGLGQLQQVGGRARIVGLTCVPPAELADWADGVLFEGGYSAESIGTTISSGTCP